MAHATNLSLGARTASGHTNAATGIVRAILGTSAIPGPLVARVALGVVMLPHGAQHLLGWFGGFGFSGTMDFFTGTLGIPYAFGVLAIAAEFFGALGLILGLFGRVAALGIASVMAVAVITTHLQFGFFMNWFGAQGGEGFEYHLLAIALAVIVMLQGSGAWSVDRALAGKGE